jgi:hypothetical protein
VRNPLEDEDAAFRVVLGTIAYFIPIVLAAWIATWLGLIVFGVATAVVILRLRRGWLRRPRTPVPELGGAAVDDTRRILVVANETLLGERLRELILQLADGVAEDVLIVCPVPGEAGDDDELPEQLRRSVEGFRAAGVNARGERSGADPVGALEDALQRFTADEVVISTYEEGRSAWLEEGVVDAVRARFDGPVTHVTESGP